MTTKSRMLMFCACNKLWLWTFQLLFVALYSISWEREIDREDRIQSTILNLCKVKCLVESILQSTMSMSVVMLIMMLFVSLLCSMCWCNFNNDCKCVLLFCKPWWTGFVYSKWTTQSACDALMMILICYASDFKILCISDWISCLCWNQH